MPANPVKTLADLQAELKKCHDAIEAWEIAPDESSPFVLWRGGSRRAVSEAVANAWADLLDFCDSDNFDDAAKPVVLAIDVFEDALSRWSSDIEIDPSNTDPGGSPALWSAWQRIAQVKPARIVQPDPIRSLIEVHGVSDRQIAIMYGFSDVRMVREEYDKPGTHYDPKTWVPPTHRRRMEKIAESWAARGKRSRSGHSKPKEAKPAPESLDSLIEQRVPSKQIAQMKGITAEEVKARADFLGLPIDGVAPSLAANPADRLADVRRQDEADYAKARQMGQRGPHAEIENIVERVAACAAEGMTPGAIAAALKPEYPGLTGPKVAKMLEPVGKE